MSLAVRAIVSATSHAPQQHDSITAAALQQHGFAFQYSSVLTLAGTAPTEAR